jgi:PPP family 3-phenylpropionic acid transporter
MDDRAGSAAARVAERGPVPAAEVSAGAAAAGRRRAAVALAAFYAAIYLAFGAYLPYWPLWLERRGLDPSAIGLLLGVTFVVRVLGIPLIGALVDRAGEYRRPLILLTALAVASFGAFAAARTPGELLMVGVLVALTLLPVPPLTEGLAVSLARAGTLVYGNVRLWGSVAFIVANVAVGALVTRRGVGVLLPWILGVLVVAVLVGLRLPSPPAEGDGARGHWIAAIPELLRLPQVPAFLAASAALQASHALYYSTSAIEWRRQGHDATAVGLLWALGVVAEVVLLARAGWVMRRFSPRALALAGWLGGVVRWTLLAAAPPLPLLVAAQLLHALSFATVHLGTMDFVRAEVPARLTATAQGIYSALSGGILLGAATFAGGALYQRFGSGAYLAMTALCVAGCMAMLWRSRAWRGASRGKS